MVICEVMGAFLSVNYYYDRVSFGKRCCGLGKYPGIVALHQGHRDTFCGGTVTKVCLTVSGNAPTAYPETNKCPTRMEPHYCDTPWHQHIIKNIQLCCWTVEYCINKTDTRWHDVRSGHWLNDLFHIFYKPPVFRNFFPISQDSHVWYYTLIYGYMYYWTHE